MLRTIFLTAVAVAIAIFGGAGSVWYALDSQEGIGALSVGPWVAYPELGSADADPYSKARVSREGLLALGRAEGLTFSASHDSSGRQLRRECDYTVEGTIPPARFWTLYAVDMGMNALAPGDSRPAALHSQQVLRRPGSIVSITLSPHAAPGNWIATSGRGGMQVMLTLYDTTIAGSTGMSDIKLPEITRGRCDG